ncbi:MAG: cytochrome c4 [Gammaproteobacteria bacterium]|nr:cytochrome c4 [Gammaproteobacteria bacterium]MCP5137447.1 cytochrome c4 [Gammaproteobacteria bacterium]
MNKVILAAATSALFALTTANPAFAAGDVAKGKEKSAVCAGCHGADGNSAAPNFPKLAGQYEGYVSKQLTEFRDGARKDPMMTGQAAALSDDDIANLSAYFADQNIKTGAADPELVSLGKRLYQGGNVEKAIPACMGCHGPTGAGNPAAGFPALAGQHADYTAKQLEDFRSESRNNDRNSMMRDIARTLSSHEMKAVASYVSGLH